MVLQVINYLERKVLLWAVEATSQEHFVNFFVASLWDLLIV